MPTVDPSISLGTILGVAALVVTIVANSRLERKWVEQQLNNLQVALKGFEVTQLAHKDSITEHTNRMATQDALVGKLIGDVNRLIGISMRGTSLRSTDMG